MFDVLGTCHNIFEIQLFWNGVKKGPRKALREYVNLVSRKNLSIVYKTVLTDYLFNSDPFKFNENGVIIIIMYNFV